MTDQESLPEESTPAMPLSRTPAHSPAVIAEAAIIIASVAAEQAEAEESAERTAGDTCPAAPRGDSSDSADS